MTHPVILFDKAQFFQADGPARRSANGNAGWYEQCTSADGPQESPVAGNLSYVDLDSGSLVATDPGGRIVGRVDQVSALGQRVRRSLEDSVLCMATDLVGGILAAGPNLNIETLKIKPDKPSTISWLH